MGTVLDALTDTHIDWIRRQPVFFVATAPDAARVGRTAWP